MTTAIPPRRRTRPADLIAAALARSASVHHMPLSPAQIRILAATAADAVFQPRVVDPAVLTPLRVELLRMAANGLSEAAMARTTARSGATIKTTMRLIRLRLGAVDRAHAVAIAMARGLITPADVAVPAGQPRGQLGRPVREAAS